MNVNSVPIAQQRAMQQQMQQEASMAAASRRRDGAEGLRHFRKARPTRRQLPALDALDSVKDEVEGYNKLMKTEKNIDWTLMRKRAELQDALGKPSKIKRTLRIYISNTVADQPWQQQAEASALALAASNATSAEPGSVAAPYVNFATGQGIPSWTLKIEGRMLESTMKVRGTNKQFSSCLKAVMIDFDRDPKLYPQGNSAELHIDPNAPPVDGFEVKRRGDQPVLARIVLHLAHEPQHFTLHPELSQVLDIKQETRPAITQALWAYIKKYDLQDQSDRRFIQLDPTLKKIFGRDRVGLQYIPEMISQFLLPAEPVVIPYTIQVNADKTTAQFVYDVDIFLQDPLRARQAAHVAKADKSQIAMQIMAIDEEIAQAAQALHNHVSKRDFMKQFSDDPKSFIDKWLSSQARDLDIILGQEMAGIPLEDRRRAEFWNKGDWLDEGIVMMLKTWEARRQDARR